MQNVDAIIDGLHRGPSILNVIVHWSLHKVQGALNDLDTFWIQGNEVVNDTFRKFCTVYVLKPVSLDPVGALNGCPEQLLSYQFKEPCGNCFVRSAWDSWEISTERLPPYNLF